jgi:hypothetical protein
MAGSIQLKKGTKMHLAFDVPVGQEPQFNMLCTFNKALDESAFLVSAPMVDGKKLVPDESQKLLFKYTEGDESNIVAGYVDDTVKEGIRSYLKIRRVAEQRQFIKRVDVRMKVEAVDGVNNVEVNLVFEPEWDKDMMTEEAKLELGFL